MGRTPVSIGRKEDAYCASFESFAYLNLGYTEERELGPGEIVVMTPEGVRTLAKAGEEMKICTFLWVYYGYPSSSYEGISVEKMRYNCGARLARRDDAQPDIVAGVPDSGTAHAIGIANGVGDSLLPSVYQVYAHLAAILHAHHPEQAQSHRQDEADPGTRPDPGKKSAAYRRFHCPGDADAGDHGVPVSERRREVHIRPACPPLLYGCKYLNFSRSSSEMDLITRQVIRELEGDRRTWIWSRMPTPNRSSTAP